MPADPPSPARVPDIALVGRKRPLKPLAAHGARTWHRWRIPFTRRTPLDFSTAYNPVTLAAERTLLDKRPLWWLATFVVLAIAPPLLFDDSVVGAAVTFAMFGAINIVWMLTLSTAGIFSLATLAVVGVAAYGTSYLSVDFGFPWWAMWLTGPLFGAGFGMLIALPAMRLEGFYYALLTVGIAELCRVWVVQSRALGGASGGLYGADGFVPADMSSSNGILLSYYLALAMMAAALGLYTYVNGQRLGRLLRAAPEKQEAFAEALGIDYRSARIKVFLISSAALGFIGAFYATNLHGASPSLFTMDQLLLLLAMIVIGGFGSTEGAVAGTLIVVVLDKVFIGLGPLRLVLIGAVMLGTVLFLRGGLFGAAAQLQSWRGKRRSEQRAVRRGKGGIVMPEEAIDIQDKQAIAIGRFHGRLRQDLKALVSDALIEEHRTTHRARRSDALERVLAYFRSAGVADKYAILMVKPFAEYRIVALSGQRGVPPRAVDDQVFSTPEAADHGVFLKRVQDLMES